MTMTIHKEKRIPPKVVLERPLRELAVSLTTRCNLACKMCSVWKKREHGLDHKRILSLLEEARRLGAAVFTASGAEIFTREDTTDILSYAEHIGFQEISVVSNGTLLLENHRIDRLEKLNSLCITISLDGPREVHDELRGKGVYDKALESLQELRKRGITVSISSVIMRKTLDRLTEVVDLAVELDIPVISMQPYNRDTAGMEIDHTIFEFSPEEESTVRKKLKNLMGYAKLKNVRVYTASMMDFVPAYLARGIRPIPTGGCFVPTRLLVVDTSGNIYPCFMMQTRMKKKSMGNVLEKPLHEIWHNEIHRELTLMGLNRKCPACFAACSDVESYDAIAKKAGMTKRIKNGLRQLLRSERFSSD